MTPVWADWHTSPKMYAKLCEFVSLRVWGTANDFGRGTALGVADGKRIISALIYHDYQPMAEVVQISGAADSPRWLTKPILWQMFDYPFNQMGCQAVVMRVDETNKRLKRILKAYGFKDYTIPRLRGRDKAECLYVLGDDEWRTNGFHKEHMNGQETASTNAAP